MKKINLFLAPIFGVSCLSTIGAVSCTTNDVKTHKFSFTGSHCSINGEATYSHDIYENDKDVKFTIVPDKNYKLPEELVGDEVDYDNKTGIITINQIKSDIHITAESKLDPAGEECVVSFAYS